MPTGATAHHATSVRCDEVKFRAAGTRRPPGGFGIAQLERVLQRKLHRPRIVHGLVKSSQTRGTRRGGLAERRQNHECLRWIQIRVIQEIKYFPPESDGLTLTDWKDSLKRSVEDNRTGSEQAVIFHISEAICPRCRKRSRIEPASAPLRVAIRIGTRKQIGPLSKAVSTPGEIEEIQWFNVRARLDYR